MLRRRKQANIDKEAKGYKDLFAQGGEEAVMQSAKADADKFWNGSHWKYESKEAMIEGFFNGRMKMVNS